MNKETYHLQIKELARQMKEARRNGRQEDAAKIESTISTMNKHFQKLYYHRQYDR